MSHVEVYERAIAAHAAWKGKMRKFVAGTLEIDEAQAGSHDACEFGRWIATRPLPEAELAPLRSAHDHFHDVAGAIVHARHVGDQRRVAAAFEVQGEFTKASAQLTNLVVKARDGR